MSNSILITLVLILLTSSAFSKGKPSLGVLQFEIKNDKVSNISDHMYSYLREDITKLISDKYNIVPAPSMDLEEMYMMFACDSPDLSCMVSIAKMMKVRYLVYGTVGSQRNKYELVLRLLDTKTKKIKKGRLLGDLVSKDSMNKNIDNALRTMFNIKKETLVVASKIRLLTINTNGIIADVFIDDKKVGVTPLTLTSDDIKLGKHVVLIKKEGYEPIKKEVLLSENKIDTIDLKLSTIVIPALKTDVAKKDTTKTDLVKKDIVKKDETLDLTKNTKPIENQKEWYQEWWVWGVAGGVIAATTLTIVLLNIDEATTTSHNVVISF